MRKLAGTITPCQSKAAARRLMRSPPAAKNVAITSTATSARKAKGSRRASRGHRRAGIERLGRPQRPLEMGAPQRERKESWLGAAISSAIAVAGRCGSPELRSSRRRPSILARHPQHKEGREGGAGEQEENAEPDGAAERRQPQPKAEPRYRQKQADHGGYRRERRPQPLPKNRPARPAQRPLQQVTAGALLWRGWLRGRRRPGTDRSSRSPTNRIWNRR